MFTAAEGRVYLLSDESHQAAELMRRRKQLFGGGSLLVVVAMIVCAHLNVTLFLASRLSTSKVIYIIRHGEKQFDDANHTAYDYACLSEKGWARAYNLKSLFGPRPHPPFRTPDALFAANYGNAIDCREGDAWYRTQATLEPLAALALGGLHLAIDNTTRWLPHLCSPAERGPCVEHDMADPLAEPHAFGACCNVGAAAKLKAKLAEPDVATILVAWEHANVRDLVLALGAPDCDPASTSGAACHLEWRGPDYDPVWALHFDATGQRFVRLETDLVQGFSVVGAEWLGPKRGCGAVAPAGFANPRRPLT